MGRFDRFLGNTSRSERRRVYGLVFVALFGGSSDLVFAGEWTMLAAGLGGLLAPFVLRRALIAAPSAIARLNRWFGWAALAGLIAALIWLPGEKGAHAYWLGPTVLGVAGLYAATFFVLFSDAQVVVHSSTDLRRKARKAPKLEAPPS